MEEFTVDSIHSILSEAVDQLKLLQLLPDYEKTFDKQLSYAESFVSKIVDNLFDEHVIDKLSKFVNDEELLLSEQEQSFVKASEALEEQNRVENMLEHQQIEDCMALIEKDGDVGKLKDELQNLFKSNQVKKEFIEKWEDSRVEQHETKLQMEENRLLKKIKDFQVKYEYEMRINAEMDAYNSCVIEETQQKIEFWKEKHKHDLEILHKRLDMIRKERLILQMKNSAIAVLYHDRERQMQEYAELKEQRRLELERIEFLNQKATRIQAWWRGIMVRHKLGPYKVKKSKSKSKTKTATKK